MRLSLIFLTCFFVVVYSYGQKKLEDYDVFFPSTFSKEEAEKRKIKQVKVLESKRFNLKKRLIRFEQYDSSGNVLLIENHKYFKYRDFELIRFNYDQGRIMKIEWSNNFTSGIMASEEFIYRNGNIVFKVSRGNYMSYDSPDTSHYVYDSIGKIDAKISSYFRDTLYYNYYKGKYFVGRSRLDTLQCEKKLLRLNNDTVYDSATREITLIDSTTNFIKKIFEYKYYNNWVIDVIGYVDLKTNLDVRWEKYDSKKAMFSKHKVISCYKYKKEILYKLDVVDKIVKYNKRGKRISTEKYYYEYFRD